MSASGDASGPLEGKSSTLFLVAGALLLVFAGNTATRVFLDGGLTAIHDTLGPAGFFVGTLGLVGLYPALARRTSAVASVAAAVLAIPVVGWFVVAALGIVEVVGALPDATVVLPGIAFVAVFLTTVLAYVLFGVASLRAGVHSRTVGVLLLSPAAVFLALIVGTGVAPGVAWLEVALDGGHAAAHLAIGLGLRNEALRTDRARPAPESTP